MNLGSLLSRAQWPLPAVQQLCQQHARLSSVSSASQHILKPPAYQSGQLSAPGRQRQQNQQQGTAAELQQNQLTPHKKQQQQQHRLQVTGAGASSLRSAAAGGWRDSFMQQQPNPDGSWPLQQQTVELVKEQQQQQQQQQQRCLQAGPLAASSMVKLLRGAAAARAAGHTAAEQHYLQQATHETLQQPEAASVQTVQTLLYAHNTGRFVLQQQQMQQLLQHLADNADACSVQHARAAVTAVRLAAKTAAAGAPLVAGGVNPSLAARHKLQHTPLQQQQMLMVMQQYKAQLKPLADRSLQCVVEQLQQAPAATAAAAAATAAAARGAPAAAAPAVTATSLTWLLKLYERLGALPLPQAEMQQLLQHASATAEQYSLQEALRVLFHSNASQLPLQQLQHQPLLDRALELLLQELPSTPTAASAAAGEQSSSSTTTTTTTSTKSAAAVLHAFENAGVVMPLPALQQLISYLAAHASHCEPGHAFRAVRSAGFAGLKLPPQQLQQLVARALQIKTLDKSRSSAALLGMLRAASHMGAQLPQQQLDALVSRLLALAPPGGMPSDEAAAALKAVACMGMTLPRQLSEPLLQPLQRDAREGKQLEVLPRLLTAASRFRVELAPGADVQRLLKDALQALKTEAKAAMRAADEASSSSSNSSSRRRRKHSSWMQQQQQERLPAALIADLVRSLQHMRAQLPTFYALPLTDAFLQQQPAANDLANYLAAFGAMNLAVSSKQAVAILQLLLQPQQLQGLTSSEVGSILWGFASMGYSLQPGVLQALVQQQLAQPRRLVAYSSTQTLWAMANMWADTAGTGNAQQGRAVPVQLLQQLLQQIHQELAAKAAEHHQQQQQQQQQIRSSSDDSATWATAGRAAAMYWQLTLAAWATAVCDAASCQPQILQMCKLLAAPHAWGMLRLVELVQLSWVHLWMCGYQWSDSGGLAACLSQQQLGDIKRARQRQVQQVAAASRVDFSSSSSSSSSSSRGAAARPAELSRQGKCFLDAANGMQAWCLGSDDENSSSSSSSFQQEQMLPKQRRRQQQQQQQQQAPEPAQGTSVSQIELRNALQSLPCIASTRLEAVTDDGMFSVDVEAVMADGRRLAVEFDGPYHYVQQVPFELPANCNENVAAAAAGGLEASQDESVTAAVAAVHSLKSQTAAAAARAAAEASAVAVGLRCVPPASIALPAAFRANDQDFSSMAVKPTALFRDKALRARGYTVVCVPFYQWASRKPKVQQWQVQRLVDAAVAAAALQQP